MFLIPPPAALPKTMQPLAKTYNAARDRIVEQRANAARYDNDAARAEAAAADQAEVLKVLEAGGDVTTVGADHENRRRATAAAYTQAARAAEVDGQRVARELADALLAHREQLVDHAAASIPAATAEYAATVEALVSARQRYDDALTLLEWAYSIDGEDVGAWGESTPRWQHGRFDAGAEEIIDLLRADAQRHEGAQRAEAERARRAEANARADAANAAMYSRPAVVDAGTPTAVG